MAEQQNIPNGIIPQMENLKRNVLPQEKLQQQFNGVHSAHSSRDSSPSNRLGQIPSSQLPPSRSIPTSQLPPSRSPITTVTQKLGQLSVGNQISPNPKFSTSTPNQSFLQQNNFGQNTVFSPITSTVPNTTPSRTITSNQVNPAMLDNVPLTKNIEKVQNSDSAASHNNQLDGANGRHQHNPSPIQPASQHQWPSTNSNLFPSTNNQISGPSSSQQNFLNGSSRVSNQNVKAPLPVLTNNNNHHQINQGPPQVVPLPQQNQFNTNMQYGSSNNFNNTSIAPTPAFQANQPKPNLHSNRYPTPTKNLQQQQSIYQQPVQFPQQPQQQPFPPMPQQQRQLQPAQSTTQTPFQPSTTFQQPPISQQQQQFQQPQFSQQQSYLSQPGNNLQNQTHYPKPAMNAYNQQQQQQQSYSGIPQTGFDKYWGRENYDLLQNVNILPPTKIEAPRPYLGQEQLDAANCSPDIFRCTMTKIPESASLLQKSRLPLGVLIHPFKDLNHLPVIQCNVIVRCRACRTYINPFVYFVDTKRWKCNLCYRINELPEEFQYDPVTKTYGDPSRRPEIKSSTIEYIAPAEYMLRPPQPAVYLFLLDISRLAIESGYLNSMCSILVEELKNLPGDARTQIGFLAYDSAVHCFSLAEGLSQPHEMIVLDIDDIFLPTPDNLLVNLKDRMELIVDLLTQLPTKYADTYDNNSALGAALQAAYKLLMATGGRVSVFQAALPNVGPGALTPREDPSQRAGQEVAHLNPANDFYKRLALECSGQQIAVDLFIVNSQYVDMATISGISRFSGGCINHFPLFKFGRGLQSENFGRCFRRYLTRKIGFEAVMRVRCTRGLAIHTFHGNFFVRSTDLLSLPNINPDAGFGMQLQIEENLSDVQTVCFQAALLYTSSKGERRIRVHTMCLPVTATLHDVIHSADQQCIVGLLSKMAVDRSVQSSLSDAREAFINVAIDILSSYKLSLNLGSGPSGLLAPNCLRVLPLYICALLKHIAFRTGTSTRLDDRFKAMMDMKSKPLYQLIQTVYPDLYPLHDLDNRDVILNSDEEPPRLQLTARCLDSKGAFLLDTGEHMVILVCPNVPQAFLNDVLGVANYNSINDQMYELPILNNASNQRLHQFINYLNEDKPFTATLQIIRDNSPNRIVFFERLIEDRVENALSYHEFLQHLKTQVK